MSETCANTETELEAAAAASDPSGMSPLPGSVGPPCYGADMTEACADLDARLERIASVAALLPARMPRIRDPEMSRWSARGLDALLVNLARGRGAFDLAIGAGLHALSLGSRVVDLKYSNVYDYAREELGIAASTAEKMERLARRLADLEVVREAALAGDISVRKAEIIAQVATRDTQVLWVLRGKENTVRSLQAMIGEPRDSEDDEILRLTANITPEQRTVVDEAFECAAKLIGVTSTKMQRLQGMAEEYLGSHLEPDDDGLDDLRFVTDELEAAKECLERQNLAWADLVAPEPVQVEEFGNEIDPWRIDAKLKGLVKMREGWDELLGLHALRFKTARAWDPLEFSGFGHYCEERLGLAERTIEQRISLERKLQKFPLLREALREKRINYEKARIVARHAEPATLPALIETAEKLTCVALRRELQAKEEAQMCARDTLTVFVTVRVAEVLKGAFRAARLAANRLLSVGECIFALAEHFVQVWGPALKRKSTLERRILARDNGLCRVPGCSRAATHVHHIVFRSQGGDDDPSNLISICTRHHLDGIHNERMTVSGIAPDNLVWKFGLRRGDQAAADANAWLQ